MTGRVPRWELTTSCEGVFKADFKRQSNEAGNKVSGNVLFAPLPVFHLLLQQEGNKRPLVHCFLLHQMHVVIRAPAGAWPLASAA